MTSPNLVRATDEQLDVWARSEMLGPMVRAMADELLQLRHILKYTSTQSSAHPPEQTGDATEPGETPR